MIAPASTVVTAVLQMAHSFEAGKALHTKHERLGPCVDHEGPEMRLTRNVRQMALRQTPIWLGYRPESVWTVLAGLGRLDLSNHCCQQSQAANLDRQGQVDSLTRHQVSFRGCLRRPMPQRPYLALAYRCCDETENEAHAVRSA